jgi:ribosomal protein L11 methyltransferase
MTVCDSTPVAWHSSTSGALEAMAALDEAIAAHTWPDGAPSVVLTELSAEDGAERWQLDAYFLQQPPSEPLARLGLQPAEPVADSDWVSASQAGLDPVRAGRFLVYAGDPPPLPPGVLALRVDAGQAFGTGHHETTRGCLRVLDRLVRRRRFRPQPIWDVGTGTGVLALAASQLWRRAAVLASDIDPVAVEVARSVLKTNGAKLGRGHGRVGLAVAAGLHHRAFRQSGKPALVLANILAGPLIALAPALARHIAPGGHLVLAGLLEGQALAVARAYEARGFKRSEHHRDGDWPTLVLVRRG